MWSRLLPLDSAEQHTALLGVAKADPLDTGRYTCQVVDWGYQQCRSLDLEVVPEPSIRVDPMSVTVGKVIKLRALISKSSTTKIDTNPVANSSNLLVMFHQNTPLPRKKNTFMQTGYVERKLDQLQTQLRINTGTARIILITPRHRYLLVLGLPVFIRNCVCGCSNLNFRRILFSYMFFVFLHSKMPYLRRNM